MKMTGIGATPGKLALAGVLSVVFVAALLVQFVNQKETGPKLAKRAEKAPRAEASKPKATPSSVPVSAPVGPPAEPVTWPILSLADATGFDPFAVAASLRPPAETVIEVPPDPASPVENQDQQRVEAAELKISELRKRGIDMILISGSQRLAVIEDKTLEIGDVYEGFRIVGISADSLTVEADELPLTE